MDRTYLLHLAKISCPYLLEVENKERRQYLLEKTTIPLSPILLARKQKNYVRAAVKMLYQKYVVVVYRCVNYQNYVVIHGRSIKNTYILILLPDQLRRKPTSDTIISCMYILTHSMYILFRQDCT